MAAKAAMEDQWMEVKSKVEAISFGLRAPRTWEATPRRLEGDAIGQTSHGGRAASSSGGGRAGGSAPAAAQPRPIYRSHCSGQTDRSVGCMGDFQIHFLYQHLSYPYLAMMLLAMMLPICSDVAFSGKY